MKQINWPIHFVIKLHHSVVAKSGFCFVLIGLLLITYNSAFAGKRHFQCWKSAGYDKKSYTLYFEHLNDNVVDLAGRVPVDPQIIPSSADWKGGQYGQSGDTFRWYCSVDEGDFAPQYQSDAYRAQVAANQAAANLAAQTKTAEDARVLLAAQVLAAADKAERERAMQAEVDAEAAREAQVLREAELARAVADQERDAQVRIDLAKQHADKMVALARADQAEEIEALKNVIRTLCFPAETPISVRNKGGTGYHSTPISSIQVGDSVVSCNLAVNGGECEFKQVQHIFKSISNRLIKLTFSSTELKTTDNHPFYVVDKKGWVEAKDLRVGDRLRTLSGETVELEDIQDEEGEFDVYNLDVLDHHNFYASDVLVHNCSQTGIPLPEGFVD